MKSSKVKENKRERLRFNLKSSLDFEIKRLIGITLYHEVNFY